MNTSCEKHIMHEIVLTKEKYKSFQYVEIGKTYSSGIKLLENILKNKVKRYHIYSKQII